MKRRILMILAFIVIFLGFCYTGYITFLSKEEIDVGDGFVAGFIGVFFMLPASIVASICGTTLKDRIGTLLSLGFCFMFMSYLFFVLIIPFYVIIGIVLSLGGIIYEIHMIMNTIYEDVPAEVIEENNNNVEKIEDNNKEE